MSGESRPRPILVAASPGSGHGTLAAALGRNSQAFDLPVLNLETEKTIYDLVFEMTGPRMVQLSGTLRALALLLSGEQSLQSVEMARRWLLERMHWPTARLADWFAERLAPRRLVLPQGAGLFSEIARDRIAALYPGADIVTLRRHPGAQARVVMAQAGGAAATLLGASGGAAGQPRQPDPIGLWLKAEEAIDALAGAMPGSRVVSVQLEDLIASPGTELARLAEVLDLAAEPADLAAMAQPELSPFAGPGPYGASLAEPIAPLAELTRAEDGPRYALPKKAREYGYS
ncbi:sulfotransferase [Roseivivax sp.]